MKILRGIVAVILIPLLVFSSGGLNVFMHYCHMSGVKTVSVRGSESCDKMQKCSEFGCCGHMSKTVLKKQKCCDSEHYFIRTIDFAASDNQAVEIGLLDFPRSIYLELASEKPTVFLPEVYRYCDFSSPPNQSAKFIVVKNQQLKLDCCVS